VTIFLTTYFSRYLAYDFTADLETQLDDVSAGERNWKDVLDRFWRDFTAALAETSELRISDVLTKIDEVLAPHLYPPRADGGDPRICPTCGQGRLNLKTARSGGAFIGCSNYPECRYTRALGAAEGETGAGERELGEDGDDVIWLKSGRFGPYVQRGEATAEVPKPPRASLPKGWEAAEMTLEKALLLLNLPRPVGNHPDDGLLIEAGIGRYGPYLKHGSTYANLPEVAEVFEIGMNRAIEVLAQKAARGPGRGRTAVAPLRELGEHPSGGAVQVMEGRYGPYVKWDKVNATLPKELPPDTVTLDQAVELVNAKAGSKGGKKKAAPKKTASKVAAKKPAAKKAAPKTAATTKAASTKAAAKPSAKKVASGKA
jgi:DNA topoisomerase-1